MGTIIRGGMIATATDLYQSDIRIEGERIHSIGPNVTQAGDVIIDANGCFIIPGGVDAHTHLDLPFGSFSTADDFASGTKAALLGGTTTIIDYATQFAGETLSMALENWHRRAEGKAYTDYGFHMAISDWNPAIAAELPWLLNQGGISSVKLYMAYKGTMQVDDSILYEILSHCRELGILPCVHCENGDWVVRMTRQLLAQGKTAPAYHGQSRPPKVEAEAVNRLITLGELLDTPVFVVHLSCQESLDIVIRARVRGSKVLAETCPQYLVLDDSRYQDMSFEAAKYVLSPPLRPREGQPLLWNALKQGWIDTVATDHCAFRMANQKSLGREDFSKIPNGIPGLEHRLLLMYTYGVHAGRLTWQDFVRITATNPAKIFGLYPRKGTIAPGSDADLVLWDPAGSSIITASEQAQQVDYTPYEGMKKQGRIAQVFLRGRQLVKDGRLTEKAAGQYLRRNAFRHGRI